MSNVIYLIAILLVGASAAFSFLLGNKHKNLTQETYNNQAAIDELDTKIARAEGKGHKAADLADAGDTEKSDPGRVFNVLYQRMLSGSKDIDLNSDLDGVEEIAYEKTFDGVNFKFLPFNKSEGDEKEFIEKQVIDIVEGKAKEDAVKSIDDAVASRIVSLTTRNEELVQNIANKGKKKEGLGAEIAKFVEAEALVKKEFAPYGVQDLKGANELLTTLEDEQKTKLSEKGALETEKEAFVEKRDANTGKLGELAEYRGSRKLSLGANSKTFKLASVDFDWGFIVIKTDKTTKFFINQKLMIIRGGHHYVGDVTVSTVEPGRIMANIDYDSLSNGERIKPGDMAILKEPAIE